MDYGRIIARGSKEQLAEAVAVEEKVSIFLSSANHNLVDNIKKIGGVTNCILNKGQLTVISRIRSNNINKIMDSVVKSGALVKGINMEKMTLEDVFLTLTNRNLRD